MLTREEEYRDFSWDFHKIAGYKPIVAQMELTFRCPLHCEHCYTDCYNDKESAKDEISIEDIKLVLDKCKQDGVLWFAFTGGDPLIRKDFTEIYIYAKKLGFIVTVFTSLVLLNNRILRAFKAYPPFNIETTLNAATSQKYKQVTKTPFFIKHVGAIEKLRKNNLPIKVKTQVTKQNAGELEKIKKLVGSLGLKFRPSTMLHGRLNKDTHPCDLRLESERAREINEKYGYFEEDDSVGPRENFELKNLISKTKNDKLFSCAVGGHAFWISPKGRMFICCSMRKPDYNLLEKGNTIKEGFYRLNREVHNMHFGTASPCRRCEYRLICGWCPGRASLETGSMEAPIPYYCELAKKEAEKLKGCSL